MKTNLLQSQLRRNAVVITALIRQRLEVKAEAKAAQLSASRRQLHATARKFAGEVGKLADIQRALKAELLAVKLAKLTVYKKHGKNDPRYTAWVESKQAAERSGENYAPVQFFPPSVGAVSCGC